MKVSLSFDGNVPFNALVNFSEIAGAADISFVSWSTRFAKINTAKGAKIRMKIIEIKMKEAEAAKAEEEAANAGPQKKEAPEVEKFITTYYEFPGNFTTNLRGSRKFLQAGIGVSTQYDDNVITHVEDHQLSLRSSILAVMSEFSEQDIEGKSGRDALAKAIAAELNTKLEELEGFGGIENVHFTSFMLQ